MKRGTNYRRMFKVSIVLLLFIVLLSGARFVWIHSFAEEEKAHIVDGELDLRNETFDQGTIFSLDGMWEFYPSTFIMEEDATDAELIRVPGYWGAHLDNENEKDEQYGYG